MKTLKIFKGDKTIWVLFLLFTIISLVAVYSSIGLEAYSKYVNKTPTALFFRHMAIVAATWVAVVALSRVNYRYFSRFALLGYWVSLLLLAVMLAMGGRWFRVPGIGQFQPSEVAKVFLVLFLARMLALKKDQVGELGTFLQLLVSIVIVAALVVSENFSTAALIFLSCFILLYYGGVNRRWWWRVFLVGLVAVVAGLSITYFRYERSLSADKSRPQTEQLIERSSTWGHRVHSWIHPDTALTQENMARMAIASGGVIGQGPGNTVHARLMTQSHNDFIYAIIIEESGLVGGIVVFLLYTVFFFRCIRIAGRCRGRFGALTVAGLGTTIYLQALVNMCVAVGVLPVTGQTLPFISYGGTAYLILGCGLGVIQSIAADADAAPQKEEKESIQDFPPMGNDGNESNNIPS